METQKVCAVCSKHSAKACARCKITHYCGLDCQKNDFSKHKELCIIQHLYDKLFDLFSNCKIYQDMLLRQVKLDHNERGIVQLHLANGRQDLEIITNKERLNTGEAVDLEVKILRVSEEQGQPTNVSNDASQWEIAQDYGKHYKIGSELPIVFTVPFRGIDQYYTRTYLLELLT